MTEESSCAVCHQPIPQGRVHYGGVSCYSCRAFFRRNTQREELLVCKGERECTITYIDRKQCTSCRYDKCIRTGMRPELVLTEDDKKKRFKKLQMKKEEDANIMSQAHKHSLDERIHEVPSLEPIRTIKEVPFAFSTRNPFTFPPHSSSAVSDQNMYSSKQLCGFKDFNRFNSLNTKNFSTNDKDFLSKLRSEVKNYVKNTKYEQIISQERSSSVQHHFIPISRRFNLPTSLSVMVKPVPLPCTISPPVLHDIKDIDAWKYFKNKEYPSRNNSPVYEPSSLPSPSTTFYVSPPLPSRSCSVSSSTSSHSFSISPPLTSPLYFVSPPFNGSSPVPPLPTLFNLSDQHHLHSDDMRPSVITGVLGRSDQYHEQQIKKEPDDCQPEEYPTSSNESIENEETKEKHTEVQEELLLNYVHKKFRTHVENIDKSSENTSPQKRKSVIFHGSFSKKLCA